MIAIAESVDVYDAPNEIFNLKPFILRELDASHDELLLLLPLLVLALIDKIYGLHRVLMDLVVNLPLLEESLHAEVIGRGLLVPHFYEVVNLLYGI